ncbi:hypothetical protein N656DRAFT_717859 [Canariomyces notabilis]|uniref:Indole-diterpene biosynthesis protein PaxU n=1 Tax=Canariomyces notabilis TaxID=2074819 RepID=A0AAN6QKE4_9PEZI|nr:hypothetical protein N656DRAFT_717859 [Canariomyces arenarius]
MQKLSPSVYLYRPSSSTPTANGAPPSSSKPAPKMILLMTWMGAREPHIAKYLVQYQALYPSATILLVRSEPRHFIPIPLPGEYAPAVPVLREAFPYQPQAQPHHQHGNGNPPQKLLIHVFSNGGCAALQHIRHLAAPLTLPPHTILFDSCPGTFRYRSSHKAFMTGITGLTRLLLSPLFHVMCASYWFWHAVIGRGKTGPLARTARGLNSSSQGPGPGGRRGGGGVEVRRTYVYSEGDKLVDWRDVEAHAREAEGKGFVVRRERFEGSEHVAHMRKEPERYWWVVKETWEGVE